MNVDINIGDTVLWGGGKNLPLRKSWGPKKVVNLTDKMVVIDLDDQELRSVQPFHLVVIRTKVRSRKPSWWPFG